MQNKVSIIVPCWGVEKYLDRCVESLVNQTLKDIEIILVDDESPDRVPEMCDEWTKKDPRIRVVHKKNAGLGMACNSGIDVATGEYIAFCDSDDWVDAEMYHKLYQSAKENKAQVVFSGIRRVDEFGRVKPMNQSDTLHKYSSREALDNLMLDMIAPAPSVRRERVIQASAKIVLYERRIIELYNIRFESERQYLSEDMLFNLDVLSKVDCAIEIPYTFYNYYVNTQSISQKVRTDRFEKFLILRDHIKARYKHILPTELQTRADRMFIGYCRGAIEQIVRGNGIEDSKRKVLLEEISKHPCWKELSNVYPISKMPLIHKVVFKALLYRQVWLLQLMYKIKSC